MDRLVEARRRLEGLLGTPATEGNEVEVLRDGVEIFPAMLGRIAEAQHTVDLLTFVYWRGSIAGRFAEVLCDRARAGVRCRVILDALGARHVDRGLVDAMEAAGVQVRWFRPISSMRSPGFRTHRKVLICDETDAFAGGVGIADEWAGSSGDGSGWRETQLLLRGPVVDGLRAAFVDDWLEVDPVLFDQRDRFPDQPQGGGVTAMVVRGESERGYSDVALLRRVLLDLALERVRISTAYLSPDDTVRGWVCDAACRGVNVQLLVPGPRSDKEIARLAAERTYDDLLEAGVEIHEFVPTMMHAKVMTIDGLLSVVGSSNLNMRSMSLDEEVDVVVLDREITATPDAHTDEDLARSHRVKVAPTSETTARSALTGLVGIVDRWI